MLSPLKIKNEGLKVSKFIDYNKTNEKFYNNLYLKDFNIVVKMPLIGKNKVEENIKIENFNLGKYTYLLSYE